MSQNKAKKVAKMRKIMKKVPKKSSEEADFRELEANTRNNFKKMGINPDFSKFTRTPDSELKMSEVLLTLIEPYIPMCQTDRNRFETLVRLGISMWNLGFLPDEKQVEVQGKIVEEFLPKDMGAQDVAEMMTMLETLLQRKKDLFPDVRVMITGHNVVWNHRGITVKVASAPLGKGKKKPSV